MKYELEQHEKEYLDIVLDDAYVEECLKESFNRLDAPAFCVYAKVGEFRDVNIWAESDGSFIDYYLQP